MKRLIRASRDQRGFNLIELMIVIAIIGLLIGVGTLAWQAVIRSGNETTAAQQIKNFTALEAQYASQNKETFANFPELVEKMGLDEVFKVEPAVKNGYVFTLTVVAPSGNTSA